MEPSILGQFVPCGQHYAQIHPYAPETQRASNAKSSKLLGEHGPASYQLHPGGCPETISITSVRSKPFDDMNFDEEIYISGSTVFWMQGNVLNKSFSFQNRNSNVRQAFWAWFPVSGGKSVVKTDGTELQRVLCIFFGETAELYLPSGRSFTVEFPFYVERAWPLHVGFLIQREQTATPMTPIGMLDYADLPDATLYDLSHPLEPIRVVTVSRKIYRENDSQLLKAVGPTHPFQDANKSVLLVTDHNFTSKLIVTRDCGSGKLRVWRYAIRMGDAFMHDSFREDFRSCMFSEQNSDFPPSNDAPLEPAYVGGSVLQEICALASPKSRSEGETKAFMAHSIDGSEILVIFEPSVRILTGFAVITTADRMELRRLFEHKASAALPVRATRLDQLDILLLQPDGSLHLWIGCDTMAMCTIGDEINNDVDEDGKLRTSKRRREIVPLAERLSPQFRNQDPAEFSLPSDEQNVYRSPSRAARIVDLKDAVCDRVNMVLSNGFVYRASFNFLSKSSLVQSCITALYCTLPASLFQSVFLRYLYFEYGSSTHCNEFSHRDEWESFATVLLSLCQPPSDHPLKSSQDATASSVPLKISTDESDEDESDGDADWDCLLSSAYHSEHKNDSFLQGLSLPKSRSNEGLTQLHRDASKLRCERTSDANLCQYIHLALLSLHLVYEDLKLYTITSKETPLLGQLLARLSVFVGWDDYVDYYGRDGVIDEDTGLSKGRIAVPELPDPQKEWEHAPPNIYQWLYHRSQQTRPHAPFPTLKDIREMTDHGFRSAGNQSWISNKRSVCERTSAICEFHQELTRSEDGAEAAVLKMVERGFKLADLETLPFGVALPFMEAIRRCREFPSKSWPDEAYVLVGRQDLAETSCEAVIPSVTCRHLDKNLKHQPPADIVSICRSCRISETEGEGDGPQEDGTDITNHDVTNLKFGHDLRLQEVQRLLQSVRPPKVLIPERKTEEADEYTKMQQGHVIALCHRTFALPVGRGILTYGTSTTMPTEEFPIPGIVAAVRNMPLDIQVNLDKTVFPSHYCDWPEFHDGVAAALRINSRYSRVSSSWTVYNCVQHDPDNYHVGFLLGLGLNGHLQDLKFVHCFNILTPHHELAMIALLLGLAISYHGTMHARVMSLLTLHVSEFCEPDRTPLYCPSLARTACVIGIGLLHMGTANRKTAERMIRQVGYLERHASESRRTFQETYSLAAGFSLGFIMLGRGKEAFGLSNQAVVDQLRRYMGAREGYGIDDDAKRKTKRKAGGAGIEEGIEGLHRAQTTEDGLCLVHDDIHTDITAPGATIAFGLIYMRTNDAEIASKLTIPESTYELDLIRPDLLLLRVLSRNLILWDGITPTEDWVLEHLPRYVREPMIRDLKDFGKAIAPEENPNIDSIRHAWTNIVAGACFSIGLKYAGSADPEAFNVLLKYLDLFVSLSGIVATNFESKILRCTVKNALDVLCTSIACVMAGTGNLLVMKRLRKLHGRVSAETPTYGHHMASHMALGLLFLGGGQYSLGTSNKAVAALLCALYPRYPNKPDDTAPHLQALRHLWALAVEPRCFVTKDVETRQSVYAPISVVVYDSDSSSAEGTRRMQMVSPCLLPDLKRIKSITIQSPRYWPVELDFTASSKHLDTILSGKPVFVKRIAGHLTYAEDKKGFMGIRSQYFSGAFAAEDANATDFSASFSADQMVVKYAQYFCQNRNSDNNDDSDGSSVIASMKAQVGETDNTASVNLASFCSSLIYETLARDEVELVPIFLGLYHAVNNLGRPQQLRTLWNVKLLLAHYDRSNSDIQNSPPSSDMFDQSHLTLTERQGVFRPSPIREAFLSSLREQLDSFFDLGSLNGFRDCTTESEERQALTTYFENFLSDDDSRNATAAVSRNSKPNVLLSQESVQVRYWLASRLVYHDVPEPEILRGIGNVKRKLKDDTLAFTILQRALPNLSFSTLKMLIGRGNDANMMFAS